MGKKLFLFLSSLSLSILCGCLGEKSIKISPGSAGTALRSASVSSINFGSVAAGATTAATTITITNATTATASASGCSAAYLTGTHSTAFTIAVDNCAANELAAGANCTIDVTANPSYPSGLKYAQLVHNCTRSGPIAVNLYTIATTTPSLALTPVNFNFGNVSVSETYPTPTSFVITNTGSQDASGCSAAVLTGVNASDFSITTDNCGTSNLAMNSSCTLYVTTTPSATGARTATLSRSCTTGGSAGTAANGITATGVNSPHLTIDTTTLDFGRVPTLGTSAHQNITITNTGLADATGCAAPTLSGTDAADFSIVTDGCGVADVTSGGGNCVVTVMASPTTVGLKRATLSRTCSTFGGTISTTTNGLYAHAKSNYLNFVEAHLDGAAGVDGLASARGVVVSPDLNFVYVTGEGDNGISIFSRDLLTGKLTYVSAFLDNTGGANNLSGVRALDISGDGKFLYAASNTENAMTVFTRDVSTGALTFLEDQIDGAGGVDGLLNASSVKVSHDGKFLYASGEGDNAIAVFTRDPVTGSLTYSTMLQDGMGGVDGLAGVRQIALSSDGATVYSAGTTDNAIGVFTRDKTTGALSYSTMLQDGVGGVDGVAGILGVNISSDNLSVYSAGNTDNAVGIFTRNLSTGALTYSTLIQDGVGGADGLNTSTACVISPDNLFLLVTGTGDNAISMMSRNPTNYAHSYLDLVQDGVGGIDALAGADSLTYSGDGRYVYATAATDNGMSVFENSFKRSDILEFEEIYQNGGSITGMTGSISATISSDASHVYVASLTDDSVLAFSRDSTTGALTFVAQYADGVGGIDGLDGAKSVAIGPDGLSVYVASNVDNSLAVFSRNSTTGALTFVEAHFDGLSGIDGLDGASSVVVSTDNSSVYVVGATDNAIVAFSRNTITGALTYVATYYDGVNGVDGLSGASFVLSPTTGFVYVVGSTDNAISIFTRNTSTSALTYVSLVQDGVGGVSNMTLPSGLAFTSDGAYAFVSATTSNSVVSFSRDTSTGLLTYVNSYVDNTTNLNGLSGASSVQLASGDKYVLVTGATDSGVAIFSLNSTSGALRFMDSSLDGISGNDALNTVSSLVISPNGYHVYTLGFGEDKLGLYTLRPLSQGFLTYVEKHTEAVSGVTGLDGASSVSVSPDGPFVYATGFNNDGLAVFSRAPGTSKLTYIETHTDGAGGVNGLDGPISVILSPDGGNVYVAGKNDNAIAVFSRNYATGALTYLETQQDNVNLVDGLNSVRQVIVSPDGNHVYAVGNIDDAVAMFTRNQTTGALTYLGVMVNNLSGVTNMDGPSHLALSPDGNFLYVTSNVSEAVVVFSRDAGTGLLTYSTSYVNGAGGISGMGFTYSLGISPDGHSLYAIGLLNNSLVHFSRNLATGALTYVSTYAQGAQGILGMSSPRNMAISPDGLLLVVTGHDDNALSLFSRDPSDGSLLYLERKIDGTSGVDGLNGPIGISFSPDGTSLYATGENEDSLAVFSRK